MNQLSIVGISGITVLGEQSVQSLERRPHSKRLHVAIDPGGAVRPARYGLVQTCSCWDPGFLHLGYAPAAGRLFTKTAVVPRIFVCSDAEKLSTSRRISAPRSMLLPGAAGQRPVAISGCPRLTIPAREESPASSNESGKGWSQGVASLPGPAAPAGPMR